MRSSANAARAQRQLGKERTMKRNLIAVTIAAALAAVPGLAQQAPGAERGPNLQLAQGGFGPGGYGMGPGMMGGYGPGYGPGGYGPGGGYGMGPGMMWGYGMGPGMMGGYGPGYGPGGYGMGPGMMWGYGRGGYGYGYGPGGGYGALDLTAAQRAKIADIEEELARKRWDAMSRMQEQRFLLQELYASGKSDDAALRKSYQAMADAQKQMFESSLEARKRIDAVLTKEQREQLQRGWGFR
jgi:Spy/CpxP family protein refolding chaperone